MKLCDLNPSRPNPGGREKININFYFHTLVPQKVLLKAFIKHFEAPQRSVILKKGLF